MSGRFLSTSYIDAIRAQVRDGRQPWADAHTHLISAADRALQQEPLSVRQNGGSPLFRQDAVYVEGRDGVRDAQANRESGRLARVLSGACLDLALAYRFTDRSDYAAKALELIHAWCVNRNTYMVPTGHVVDAWTPGGRHAGDVIIFGAFHNLFLAAYLLGDCPEWGLYGHAAVRRWVRAMIEPQREVMIYEGREMFNNWEDARLRYLAKGALMLDDVDLLIYVFERWRHILPMKMTDEGELHRETMRTRSMPYSLAALGATVEIAEIARQHGEDLYGYSACGRRLKTAVDYVAYYLLHMDEWPFEMLHPMSDESQSLRRLALFEMAHRQWGEQRYLDVIDAYGGRPVVGLHATLLYAT